MKTAILCGLSASVLFAVACNRADRSETPPSASPVDSLAFSNAMGLTVRIAEEHSDPTLWLSIPSAASGHNAVLVLLPEHVTVRRQGKKEAEHLYLWRPGTHGARPNWVRVGNSLQYERDLSSGIHFLARVSLQPDGVLFHYEFGNGSDFDFESVQAITDPRMLSPLFHDVRLERTYVHEPGGFVLLASDMPERVTMPLNKWLPNRYRISYSLSVEKARAQKQPDGITFFNAERRADEPVLATISTDGQWIMATFSRKPGNLWTNPDLTCQHADPEIPLPHRSKGIAEEKILLFRGTLDDVFRDVEEQRGTLE